jgi:excisionase family DNA binding protein
MTTKFSEGIVSHTATGFDHLPAVLTSKEAARTLRIGIKELRQLIATGHLPAARLGPRRVIRVAKSAVLSVLGGANPRAI